MANKLSEQYGPWAMIAGGSEGIGFSFARQLAAAGINLILLARREASLTAAKTELEKHYDVEVDIHSFDLTADDIEDSIDHVCADREIGLFIYNAGAAHGAEIFHDAPLSSALYLVNLNCRGPLAFCHKLGQGMRKRGRGGIILLSSLAGFSGAGYVTAYSATKAFDIALAEGLWCEMKPYGVDVLGLVAGATDTPAMRAAGAQFDYDGPSPPMQSDDVASEGLAQLGKTPLWIAGENNRAAGEFLRSPDRVETINAMTAGSAAFGGDPFPMEARKL